MPFPEPVVNVTKSEQKPSSEQNSGAKILLNSEMPTAEKNEASNVTGSTQIPPLLKKVSPTQDAPVTENRDFVKTIDKPGDNVQNPAINNFNRVVSESQTKVPMLDLVKNAETISVNASSAPKPTAQPVIMSARSSKNSARSKKSGLSEEDRKSAFDFLAELGLDINDMN